MANFDPNGTNAVPTYPRSALRANFVAVMNLRVDARGFQLIPQSTRCIRRFDVHELIVTEEPAAPGRKADRVAYLGFVEFQVGGVMAVGDHVCLREQVIGVIAGFDDTHMPNHQNIVVRVAAAASGSELQIALGQLVEFTPPTAE